MCFYKPRVYKSTAKTSKAVKTQINDTTTRRRWIYFNPPEDDFWYCHYCGVPLTVNKDLMDMGVEKLTLDHKLLRSERPDLRYDTKNLLACCFKDNSLRGSMKYEAFCLKYYPHLADLTDGTVDPDSR